MPLPLWYYLSPEQREAYLRQQAAAPSVQVGPTVAAAAGLAPQPGEQPGPTRVAAARLAAQPGVSPSAVMARGPVPGPTPGPVASPPSVSGPPSASAPSPASPIPGLSGRRLTPEMWRLMVEQANKLFDPKTLDAPLTDEETGDVRKAGWAGVAQAAAGGHWADTPAQALARAFGGYAAGASKARGDVRDARKEALALGGKSLEWQAKLAELFNKNKDTFGSAETGYYVWGDNGQPVQVVAGTGPKPGTPFAIQDPSDPSKQILVNPNTMAPLHNPDGTIARPKPEGSPTEISRLINERDALAPGDPRRDLIEAKIKKTVEETGDQSVVAIQGPDGKPIYVPRSEAVGKRPADAREASAGFNQARDLRSSFEKLTSEHRIIVTKYGQLEAAFGEDSKSGDVAALFAYMKLLDPTSVVRESEFATAGQAGALPDTIQAWWDKLTGQGRLTPAQRQEILSAGRSQIAPYEKSYNEIAENYRKLAESFQLKPEDVVPTLTWPTIPGRDQRGQRQGPVDPDVDAALGR